MGTTLSLPWVALLLLGAGHGVNPAMGWLFAVARGLQERRDSEVWRTLLPLAAGHALAIGAVIGTALLVGLAIPMDQLQWVVAAMLIALGVYRLCRHAHPSAGGMRVGMGELTLWSFLMASGHGTGLMVLPFMLRGNATPTAGEPSNHAGHGLDGAGGGHAHHMDGFLATVSGDQILAVAATLVHTAGYLIVTGAIAAVVYRRLGLRLLRQMWINIDLIWAFALIATGVLTMLI